MGRKSLAKLKKNLFENPLNLPQQLQMGIFTLPQTTKRVLGSIDKNISLFPRDIVLK